MESVVGAQVRGAWMGGALGRNKLRLLQGASTGAVLRAGVRDVSRCMVSTRDI